jgi:hypothetical protein
VSEALKGLEPDCEGVEPVPNHPTTTLTSSQVNHDQLRVELIEPADLPAMVRIVWPLHPTVVDPTRFPDAAAIIVKLFADAHTALAGIKARRRL